VSVVADSVTTVTFTLECFAVGSPRIHFVDVRETLQECGEIFAFQYTIAFTDSNGDVTVAEATVQFVFVWDDGSTGDYTSADPSFHLLQGTPFEGTFLVLGCLGFPVFTQWADATLSLTDAAGLTGNSFTVRITKPAE
jgi:hypothetical protein